MVLAVVLTVGAMVAMEAKSFKPHGSASEAWTCVQPSTPTTAEKELHAFFGPAQLVGCDRASCFWILVLRLEYWMVPVIRKQPKPRGDKSHA